jgi:hypothetical protein
MAECSDPKNQQVNGAFPANNTGGGALEINFDANTLDIWNPNAALSAVNTFTSMNNIANKMFGIDARWFRAVPQQRSKDVIFQEYTLYCVEETPLCIKVILPDGNFPDEAYQHDLMGLEYPLPTEIQIDKAYWEEVSGFGTAPQKKDIVYLPMPNKLFQVESSYLKRGFMQQETTWIVNLIKYQPEAARREGNALKETLDQYTVSQEELFGEEIENNIKKITNDKQFSPLTSTSEDKYKELDDKLQVLNYNLDFHGIVVAETIYDLNTSQKFNAITYKNSNDIISSKCDRSITTWVNSREDKSPEYDIVYIERNSSLLPPANFRIKIRGKKRFGIGDNFHIYRSEFMNLYARVIKDSGQGIYECLIDEPVLEHLDNVQSSWWTKWTNGWKLKVKDPITIIDGINQTNGGFRVTINADQYIKILYGYQEHIAILDKRLINDHWYGLVVNIGNTWGQYNVNLWEPHPTDSHSRLRSVFYETLPFSPQETEVEKYTVDKSFAYITNIRLFDSTIEEEKQTEELMSYFTQNADRALILDNADPRTGISYISQQR